MSMRTLHMQEQEASRKTPEDDRHKHASLRDYCWMNGHAPLTVTPRGGNLLNTVNTETGKGQKTKEKVFKNVAAGEH